MVKVVKFYIYCTTIKIIIQKKHVAVSQETGEEE